MKRQRFERSWGPSVAVYRGRRRGGSGRLIAAAVCAVAGMALISVRIWGMRFSGFVLWGIAAVLAVSMLLDRLAADHSGLEAFRQAFYAVLTAGLVAFCLIEAFVVSRGIRESTGLSADAVIVLGAGVNGKTPSLSLRTRLDAALAYAGEHPDIPVVLSGGRGYGEDITEARCMYDWLTERGVDPDRLILEEQAANTAENLLFSGELLQARGLGVEDAIVAVVTNDFHIARAELIAEKQDYGAVVGVPAKLPWAHLTVNYYLREAFAVVKSVVLD